MLLVAQYCICCILQWATYHADAPRCPQCKSYFNYIYLYKNLDGSLNDYLQEESVTLLMRARWFNVRPPPALFGSKPLPRAEQKG